jgi:hypothetical protein
MLTRSFIKSYLHVNEGSDIHNLEEGLKTINKTKTIRTLEPTDKEKKEIKNKLVSVKENTQKSFQEFLYDLFESLEVEAGKRKKLEEALATTSIEKFDEAETIEFIEKMKNFY